MTDNDYVFREMPISKALVRLSVPTIVSQLITTIYNLSDTFFIGQTNDPFKVGAASLGYTVFFLLTSLANLFGIGGGSLISRLLGVQDTKNARKVCAFSLWMASISAMLYSGVVFLFKKPLLIFLGGSQDTLTYALDYTLWVTVIGSVPTVMSVTMGHLLRNVGYAKESAIGLGMGGILNIILDPLFMFVILPNGMEVTGAAIATVLSNICAMGYFLIIFRKHCRDSVLSLSPKEITRNKRQIASVFSVGIPSALSVVISSFATGLVNKFAAGYGDIELAAAGIVKKIDMLPYCVAMGLAQGMMPLVAYNYSSGNHKRMRQTIHYAWLWSLSFALVLIAAFELFPTTFVRLFIDEAVTIQLGAVFLRIASLAIPFVIVNFQLCYVFQGMGKGKESLLLSCCRQGIIYIPVIFLLNWKFGVYGIIAAQAVSDFITMAISLAVYWKVNQELHKISSSVSG